MNVKVLIVLLMIISINVVCGNNIALETIKNVATNICKNVKSSFRNIKHFVNNTLSAIKVERRKLKLSISSFFDKMFNVNNTEQGQTNKVPDGDIVMAFRSSIAAYGYNIVTHKVFTADGYILKIHKLISSIPDSVGIQRNIVLIHHGLFGSSMDWLLLGPNDSLPFILLEAGFEVWLANSRGNQFSKEHISKRVNSTEFWDFTFHEIGVYDLRAIFEYLYDNKSEHSRIVYVGYSLSGTALLVLLSLLPQYNKMLTCAVLLAPLIFMTDIKGPLKDISDVYYQNYNPTIARNQQELSEKDETFESITKKYCNESEVLMSNVILCLKYGINVLSNINDLSINSTSGSSEKILIHYFQMIKTGRFKMFDYGIANNSKMYGVTSPPEYALKDISVPLYIFTSTGDTLSSTQDINTLKSFIPHINHTILKRIDFSHAHFLLGRTAPELVYKNISRILINHL